MEAVVKPTIAASRESERSSDWLSRERLAGYDPQKMNSATVLVAGAGALAQMLVLNLALPGVGEIRLVDFDVFESHNATRSLFYPTAAEQQRWGMKKATIVAHKAYNLMLSAAPVMRYATTAVQALGLGGFDGVDVVVSGVDNPRARAYLGDASRVLGLPLIEAGFDGTSLALSCFPPTAEATMPCYRCGNPSLVGTFSCQRYAAEAEKAGITPAIQPGASALAGLQAEATIQAIHGEYPTGFRRTILDVRKATGTQYQLSFNPDCEGAHHRFSGPKKLDVIAEQTLSDLVTAIEAELGVGAEITLPEPVIIDATCMKCGNVIAVAAPEWAYDMNPRCKSCNGPWTSLGEPPEGYSPTKPKVISRNVDSAALDVSCRSAGLPPMAIFAARPDGAEEDELFQLAGRLDDLYETVGQDAEARGEGRGSSSRRADWGAPRH